MKEINSPPVGDIELRANNPTIASTMDSQYPPNSATDILTNPNGHIVDNVHGPRPTSLSHPTGSKYPPLRVYEPTGIIINEQQTGAEYDIAYIFEDMQTHLGSPDGYDIDARIPLRIYDPTGITIRNRHTGAEFDIAYLFEAIQTSLEKAHAQVLERRVGLAVAKLMKEVVNLELKALKKKVQSIKTSEGMGL